MASVITLIQATWKRCCGILVLVIGFLLSVDVFSASSVDLENVRVLYYRYVDEHGTRSTGSSIPPKYAQKGYEIITRSGKVIKVPAAPDPEDIKKEEERLAAQRKESAEFELLARRYSSVNDIYSARDRRLTHLNASIAILKNNIESIKSKTSDLTTRAADSERAGRSVPPAILRALEETKAELESTRAKLRLRTLERDEIHQRFEEDVKLFERGKAFRDARRAELRRSNTVR